MAKTYSAVMAEINKLQAEAHALRQKEVAGVVKRIREAVDHYGLTAADLGLAPARGARRAVATRKTAAEAKYGDGQGNVWGGRGPRPAWLREALAQGRTLEEFALAGSAASAGDAGAVPAKKRAGPATKRKAGQLPAAKGRRGSSASRRARVAQPAEAQAQENPPQEEGAGV